MVLAAAVRPIWCRGWSGNGCRSGCTSPSSFYNRVGAGGNIAAEAVAHSAPDGYTILTCVTADAINATLYANLDFDFPGDFAPIAGVIQLPMVLLVNPAFPAKTLPEFIAYAKANPGKINFASPGIGTPMHVAIELLKMQAGIDVVHVPYRGPAPAFTDLFGRTGSSLHHHAVDRDRLYQGRQIARLAVTREKRAELLPDVAAVSETLPGFDATPGTDFARQRHAAGHRRSAQQHYHRRACRPADGGQVQGSRRRDNPDGRRRIRQVPGRRNRKMGQGGQVR